MGIDEREAPKGFIAIENSQNSDGCEVCAFSEKSSIRCFIGTAGGNHGDCSAQYRQDGTDVHFIEKEN